MDIGVIMYNICSNCGCAVNENDYLCPACGELVLQPMSIQAWLSSGNYLSDVYDKIAEDIFKKS